MFTIQQTLLIKKVVLIVIDGCPSEELTPFKKVFEYIISDYLIEITLFNFPSEKYCSVILNPSDFSKRSLSDISN